MNTSQDWIKYEITKQDIRYCYIVISYFIQSCEVFNATT
ncbi:ABC-three component system protein [Peptoniphilus vaginalis]